MKVNLIRGNTLPISGYVNLHLAQSQENQFQQCDPTNLNAFVDDAEAEELVAYDILNVLSPANADKAIRHWVTKLAHGGTIIVGGINIISLAKIIIHRTMSLEEINQELYGSFDNKQNIIKCALSITTIAGTLEALGLKVIKKRLNGIKFIVMAVRP